MLNAPCVDCRSFCEVFAPDLVASTAAAILTLLANQHFRSDQHSRGTSDRRTYTIKFDVYVDEAYKAV
jgi:hypothetical protein